MADNIYDKPITYEDRDGRVVYRASSLGFCPGALVRSRLGITPSPPPEMIENAWGMGRANEDALIKRGLAIADYVDVQDPDHLTQYGPVVQGPIVGGDCRHQVETEIECGKHALVRCHPDGIAVDRNSLKPRVVEAKLLSGAYWNQIGSMRNLPPVYKWQLAVEMHSTGLPALYIVGVKAEDKTWDAETGLVYCFQVDEPPYSLLDIQMRVWQVEGYVARGEMPDCPQPFMYPCPWWKEHPAAKPRTVESTILDALAGVYHDLGEQIERLKTRREEASDGILKWYDDQPHETVDCGVYRIVPSFPNQGNVSWKGVAEKYMPDDVDLDAFRGEPSRPSVRVERTEDNG